LIEGHNHLFYGIPILPFINPHAFVNALLALHPTNQRQILAALHRRYDYGALLESERAWLTTIRGKLQEKADGTTSIGKYRLRTLVRMELDSLLDKNAAIAG
jgi:hypothetical protein